MFVLGFMAVVLASFAPGALPGPELLSRPSIPARSTCMSGRRSAPASRRRRRFSTTSKQTIRQIIPPDQLGVDRRQHRPAGQRHQPGLLQLRRRSARRTATSSLTERRSTAPRRSTSRRCARSLPRDFPGTSFAFLPADIVSQILNFGAPAPIDVHGQRPEQRRRRSLCRRTPQRSWRASPALADARIQQSSNYPEFDVDIDRTRADELGITETDVTNSLVDQSRRQLPDRARLLAQSPKRGVLSDRGADPAISHRQPLEDEQYPGDRRGRPRRMQMLGAPRRLFTGEAATRWSRTTRSSRPSTSSQPRKAGT